MSRESYGGGGAVASLATAGDCEAGSERERKETALWSGRGACSEPAARGRTHVVASLEADRRHESPALVAQQHLEARGRAKARAVGERRSRQAGLERQREVAGVERLLDVAAAPLEPLHHGPRVAGIVVVAVWIVAAPQEVALGGVEETSRRPGVVLEEAERVPAAVGRPQHVGEAAAERVLLAEGDHVL